MQFSKLPMELQIIVLELYYFYGVYLQDLEPKKFYPVSNKTYRRLDRDNWKEVVDKKNLKKRPVLVRRIGRERF
jgi:hypothetical protein